MSFKMKKVRQTSWMIWGRVNYQESSKPHNSF